MPSQKSLSNHTRVFSRAERRAGVTSPATTTNTSISGGSSSNNRSYRSMLQKPSPSTVTESTAEMSHNNNNESNKSNTNKKETTKDFKEKVIGTSEYIINKICEDAADMIDGVLERITGKNSQSACGGNVPIREIRFCSDTTFQQQSNGKLGEECYSDGISCLELPTELQDSSSTTSITPRKTSPLHTPGSSQTNNSSRRDRNQQYPSKSRKSPSPLADINENCGDDGDSWTATMGGLQTPGCLSFHQESKPDLQRISTDLIEKTKCEIGRTESEVSDASLNLVTSPVTPSGPEDLYKYMLQTTPRNVQKAGTTKSRFREDATLTPGSLLELDFERDLILHWGLQRNVIPGLDRWKGVLRKRDKRNNGKSCIKEGKPLGLVQGFWIRRYPRPIKDEKSKHNKSGKKVRKTFRPSWGPKEISDLVELNNIDSSLGYFWQKTLRMGWPEETACLPTKVESCDSDLSMNSDDSAAVSLVSSSPKSSKKQRHTDKENDYPSPQSCVSLKLEEYKQQAARKRQRSRQIKEQRAALQKRDAPPQVVTDECCLITQVWVAPQHRGDGWGLLMVNKAARAIPRRYNRLKETANLAQGDLSLVLACPPYNKRLQDYFTSSKGGWNTSWDRDFLVK